MSAMTSQITSLKIVNTNKTSKLRVTGLCAGIHRWPVNSPHKGPVTRSVDVFFETFDDSTEWPEDQSCKVIGDLMQNKDRFPINRDFHYIYGRCYLYGWFLIYWYEAINKWNDPSQFWSTMSERCPPTNHPHTPNPNTIASLCISLKYIFMSYHFTSYHIIYHISHQII